MTTPTITETAERRRTVAVATSGTVLALVAYTTPVGTLAATASALGAGPSGQAWILSSMSCGLAVALLPAGAIGDDNGRRRMFVVGALVLAAASVVATFAPDTVTLVLARVGQGLGAAAVLACGLGLIGHVVPAGPARIRATGVWGAGVGAGIAIGPLVAAGLAEASESGWRIPYAVLAVAAALLAVWAARGWSSRPPNAPGPWTAGACCCSASRWQACSRGWWRPAQAGRVGRSRCSWAGPSRPWRSSWSSCAAAARCWTCGCCGARISRAPRSVGSPPARA